MVRIFITDFIWYGTWYEIWYQNPYRYGLKTDFLCEKIKNDDFESDFENVKKSLIKRPYIFQFFEFFSPSHEPKSVPRIVQIKIRIENLYHVPKSVLVRIFGTVRLSMMATPENRQIFNPLRNIFSTAASCFDGLEIERYCDENIPIIDIPQTSATKKTNSARVVKRAQNPIVLFAKLRKPQFHKLRKLRKFRIAIYVFCENSEFSVCDFLFQ